MLTKTPGIHATCLSPVPQDVLALVGKAAPSLHCPGYPQVWVVQVRTPGLEKFHWSSNDNLPLIWAGTLVPRQGEDSAQGTVQGWADLEPAGCPLPALSRHWASDIQPESPPLPRLLQSPGFPRGSGFLNNAKRQGPMRCQTREIALPCLSKKRKASAVPRAAATWPDRPPALPA